MLRNSHWQTQQAQKFVRVGCVFIANSKLSFQLKISNEIKMVPSSDGSTVTTNLVLRASVHSAQVLRLGVVWTEGIPQRKDARKMEVLSVKKEQKEPGVFSLQRRFTEIIVTDLVIITDETCPVLGRSRTNGTEVTKRWVLVIQVQCKQNYIHSDNVNGFKHAFDRGHTSCGVCVSVYLKLNPQRGNILRGSEEFVVLINC